MVLSSRSDDVMFTKLIIHEDWPLNLGESTYFHDFMLEVSKDTYKGACHDTVCGLVSVLSTGGQDQCRLFVSTCQWDITLIDVMWAKQAP
jgi:hypothetical protein